jgi:NADH-quinone oxidoreductase subunit J
MTQLLFFYFAGVIVVTAIYVVASRNPIYSALSLLVMFFHVAGLYVLLNAEFIAAIQIIVYAGAILVLYLFVVMLLNLRQEERYHRHFALGVFLGLVIFVEIALAFAQTKFSAPQGNFTVEKIKQMGNTQAIGQTMYTTYLFPFEVASLILLVAMVGAIVLAKKGVIEK